MPDRRAGVEPDVPALVVSGDGRIFTPAPASTPAPGPLMEHILVRQTIEDGLQALLRVVDSAGLLASPPDYPERQNVAEAPVTVLPGDPACRPTRRRFVRTSANFGRGCVHRKYALRAGATHQPSSGRWCYAPERATLANRL